MFILSTINLTESKLLLYKINFLKKINFVHAQIHLQKIYAMNIFNQNMGHLNNQIQTSTVYNIMH